MSPVFRGGRRCVTLAGLVLLLTTILAIPASPAEASSLTVAAASGSVAPGETVSFPIVLSEAPSGLAGYDLTVTLSNPTVARLVGAELPDFGLTSQVLISSSEIRLRAADLIHLTEAGATNITLATLDVEGLKKGKTEIQIEITRLDDDDGYSIEAQVIDGSLTVQRGSGGGKGGGDGSTKGGKGWGKGGKK